MRKLIPAKCLLWFEAHEAARLYSDNGYFKYELDKYWLIFRGFNYARYIRNLHSRGVPDFPVPSSTQASATTDNDVPTTSIGILTEGVPVTLEVWTGSIGEPVTSADVQFNHTQNASYDVGATSVSIQKTGQGTGPYTQYAVYATVTFPEEGEYGVTVTVNGNHVVENPGREAVIVYDAPMIVNPVNFTVPAGGYYEGPVATFTDLGPSEGVDGYTAWTEQQGSATEVPATIEPAGGNSYIVYANLDYSFSNPGSTNVLVGVWDNDEYGPNPQGGGVVSDHVIVTAPQQSSYSSSITGVVLQSSGNQPAEPPLVILDTTDPNITDAGQVNVSVGAPPSSSTPIPIVTGVSLTNLSNGVTQIVINGVISAVQPGTGPVASAPLTITLGNEAPLTTQVVVDQTLSDYIVNPVVLNSVAGQPLQNVQVATVAGPANGSYSATIAWGDGDTSTGVITALGGGQFSVTGSKPHPYATAGTDTITVTVNGPGDLPAPPAQTTATVLAAPPVIISNPTSQTATAGQTATFTAFANGADRAMAGQHQWRLYLQRHRRRHQYDLDSQQCPDLPEWPRISGRLHQQRRHRHHFRGHTDRQRRDIAAVHHQWQRCRFPRRLRRHFRRHRDRLADAHLVGIGSVAERRQLREQWQRHGQPQRHGRRGHEWHVSLHDHGTQRRWQRCYPELHADGEFTLTTSAAASSSTTAASTASIAPTAATADHASLVGIV